MTKTTSSRKAATLCAVGTDVIRNANKSSMNVLNALYMNALHGRCATDFNL